MYAFEQHLPSKKLLAPLAQLAEQLTLNHRNPRGKTAYVTENATDSFITKFVVLMVY